MNSINGRRKIRPDDLLRLCFIEDAVISPDGELAACTVITIDENREYSAIWVVSMETGKMFPLTSGRFRDMSPRWSKDGDQIAFRSDRNGSSQLYMIPANGGLACKLTDMPGGVLGGPLWSPDGKTIAFTSFARDFQFRDPSKPYRITRPVYRIDELGMVDDCIQQIYLIPSEGGGPRQLTDVDYFISLLAWSPDGHEILYGAMFFPDSEFTFPHLYSVNLQGEEKLLVKGCGDFMYANWTPDGEHIVYIAPPPDSSLGATHQLWIAGRDGSNVECRTANLNGWVGARLYLDTTVWPRDPIIISQDGLHAYVNVNDGGVVRTYRISLTGPELCKPVQTGDRSCYLYDGNDQHLLFVTTSFTDPNELAVSRLDGSGEKQLSHLNNEALDSIQMAEGERFEFMARDGVEVEGFLVKPPVGCAPFPTILFSHGGPHTAWGNRFQFEFQLLAGAGYAVAAINYRGSVGYGEKFSAASIGNTGWPGFSDSMAGLDFLIHLRIADPDRLGCCGHSFGGYLTCWIVGHTGRFKAAVAESPITNFHSIFATINAYGYIALMMGGFPYEIPDVYSACSPVIYAHQCKTPTLLVVNEEDYSCPAEQSEQFYAILKSTGCITEMLRLPDSSHDGAMNGPIAGRLAQDEALLAWFERYV
ncbi:MAG: S9 family peptidase [Anaerolineales bacterium]|nr:S9 family peptidase [Anaerolineales bacterium]